MHPASAWRSSASPQRRARRSAPLSALLSRAEDAREDRVDVLQVIGIVELRVDRRGREALCDLFVGLQEAAEIALALPDLHGVALHRAVSVLAAHAGLR